MVLRYGREIKRGEKELELEEVTLSRSLVNCERNVEDFRKTGELNQCVDPGERGSRVGKTERATERGVG